MTMRSLYKNGPHRHQISTQ